MPYSASDAAAALKSVEITQRRTSIFQGYEGAAPYFFLWGFMWIIGYTGSEFYRQYAGLLWLFLNVAGISAGLIIHQRQTANRSASAGFYKSSQYLGFVASAAVFVAATYFILKPTCGPQLDAFPALLVAFIYTAAGFWHGMRFTVVGALVTALTVLGFAFLPQHFALWMAIVGGTTLLTTGVWLRNG